MFILSILFFIVGFVFLLHGYLMVNTGYVSHETLKYIIYFISVFCFGISAVLFSLNKIYKFFINASTQKGNSISLYNYDMNNVNKEESSINSQNISLFQKTENSKIYEEFDKSLTTNEDKQKHLEESLKRNFYTKI